VAACGRAHDFANETGFDQFMRQRIAMRSRIDDQSQILCAAIAQGPDQHVGKAGTAEAGNENRCSIRNIRECLGSGIDTLIDWHAAVSPGGNLPPHPQPGSSSQMRNIAAAVI
jgi:hypothetical protein